MPRLPLMRELSAKLTEGENGQNDRISPTVSPYGELPPWSEGGLGCAKSSHIGIVLSFLGQGGGLSVAGVDMEVAFQLCQSL